MFRKKVNINKNPSVNNIEWLNAGRRMADAKRTQLVARLNKVFLVSPISKVTS